MSGIAFGRLAKELKQWHRDHPVGFEAHPTTKADGDVDLLTWECIIPGKMGTAWEGGAYKLHLNFTDNYTMHPPECRFDPSLFHPNVHPSGRVKLLLLEMGKEWRPTVTIKDILFAIQNLLCKPNMKDDPAHEEAFMMFCQNRLKYEETIRAQALSMATAEENNVPTSSKAAQSTEYESYV